jgi:thioredoxin
MGCRGSVEQTHGPVENLTHIATAEQFEEAALRAPTPVLVDLYATWCPPCRKLAPVLNRLAPTYKGKVAFVKVDVDKVPAVARRYGVQSIPTLLILRDGKEVKRLVGYQSERRLRAALDAATGG